ncbi:lipopolysaccharide heptosyltransferase II [Candidatus Woesearchaeota archaeon]|nr:lipopolysaccharide heptosyltransferase II [Candidatus Woesearchaeota archaeon]
MKILLIRSGALGDVLMTTPVLSILRKRFPEAEISYLTGKWSAPILKDNSDIDEIIEFDDGIVVKKKFFELLKLAKAIRKKRFDVCFVFDKAWQWGLFAKYSGIKKRYGFARNNEGLFHTKSTSFDGTKHEIDCNLELLGLMDIRYSERDRKTKVAILDEDLYFARDFIGKLQIKGKLIGVAPGGARNPGQEMAEKRWPLEQYAELIEILEKKNTVILFGGDDDLELVNEMLQMRKINPVNTIGKTTLKQSLAIMKYCSLFITHDSGASHMAYAVDIPLVALFGPTPAERFAPPNSAVIKSRIEGCPCYDIYGHYKRIDCMAGISVKDVIERIKGIV